MAVQKHLSSFVLSNRQCQEHQEGRTLAEKQLGLELCYCGIVGQAALDQYVQLQQGEDKEAALLRALNIMMTMTLMMRTMMMVMIMMMITLSTGTSSREQAALSRAQVVAHFAAHS